MSTLDDLFAGLVTAPAQPVAEHVALPVPDLALPLLPYQHEAVRFALSRQE